MSRLLCILLTAAALAACEPAPTPYPADLPDQPSATPSVVNTPAPSDVRYALGANAAALASQPPFQARSIDILDGPPDSALLGKRYDIAADFGLFAGAAASPLAAHVSLVINTELPPLDVTPTAEVVRSAAVPPAGPETVLGAQLLVTPTTALPALRTQLANAGWPDGFNLTGAVPPVPGASSVLAALRAVGIEVRPALPLFVTPEIWQEDRFQLALIVWYAPETRAQWAAVVGSNNVVDLYTLPIGYIALPTLELTFTPDGWPLPTAWQPPTNGSVSFSVEIQWARKGKRIRATAASAPASE